MQNMPAGTQIDMVRSQFRLRSLGGASMIGFHKSFPLGKLMRLNVSKRGLGVSVGPRGASVSFGRRGTFLNVSPLPGSGIRVRQRLRKRAKPAESAPAPVRQAEVERNSVPFLWCLLFGPIYFAAKGVWLHAVIALLAALATMGLSWLIYPFFAKGIVYKAYARRGWQQVGTAQPEQQLSVVQA
jgi:hypothetical protein